MHDFRVKFLTTSWMWRFVAMTTLLFFLATSFRAGWQRDETDFPNYYTAAVLVRKGKPLRNFYDWTWFAREMNKAGLEGQLGNYFPHTPLTMLPMVGFAGLSMQRAKQAWLICNLFFLAGTLWMLSRVTGRAIEHIWLFTFCGYYSLSSNFLLGQYYVFLLFLLTLTFYLLHTDRIWTGGLTAGVAFALKLYGGPYLLYFVATRRWKTVAGMITAIACAIGLAIALFGWPDVRYYAQRLLPRSLEGGAIDPYNALNQTIATMLRICFLSDPQLNPHPLWNAPALFFFLHTFFDLMILLFACLGADKATSMGRDFGWFLIAVLLLSTNVASYTFILVLLPFVLLLDASRPLRSAYLAVSCVLLAFPVHMAWIFPKVWLLLALFVVFGWERWRTLSPNSLALAVVALLLCSVPSAWKQMHSYEDEPARTAEQISAGSGSIFASFPAITSAGLFFQSMGDDRYVLRWLHNTHVEDIRLEGNAFRPTPLPDGSIVLEEVKHGVSAMMRFDPTTRQLSSTQIPVPVDDTLAVVSPDGKWQAFTSDETGTRHLWLRSVREGQAVRLGGGNCDSSWPAWELDSRSIVFASDCGRGVGLPALYRIQIPIQPR